MQTKNYDVIIVGGGMVGAAAACLFAQAGLHIALVDHHSRPQYETADNPRVSALNLASVELLQNLSLWEDIKVKRLGEFEQMFVWDACGHGQIHFDSLSIGQSSLGYIVENSNVQCALWDSLAKQSHVHLYTQIEIASLNNTDNQITLVLVDKQNNQQHSLQAHLLIGADGANSIIRRTLAIHSDMRHYEQSAIVATVTTEKSHSNTAWQRFLPTGPLAFLPLWDSHLSSIVWSTSTSHANELKSLTSDSFCQTLTNAFENRLGCVKTTSPLALFPLNRHHAQNYISHRIALIGDATHTIHPLAGQGVNLGLLDAKCLAGLVITAKNRDRDIGSTTVLRRYERTRRGHNQMMIRLMEGFHYLFGSESQLLIQARNFGLNICNRSFIKYHFMRQACGL